MIHPMARDIGTPLTRLDLRVAEVDAGLRLDHLLARDLPWRSRSDLQRRIRDGLVLVDGVAARPAQRVQAGMAISVMVTDCEGVAGEVPTDLPLNILFEDEWLLVLNKDSGTVVHPVGRHVNDTLLNVLHARHAREPHPPGRCAPMIVHRLDKDTSGVLLFATDLEVRKNIGMAFETRRVTKSYLALVHGEPREERGHIEAAIGADEHSAIRMKRGVTPEGQPSTTGYETLQRCGAFSLLRFLPHTGRQHQIRVHAEFMGHPLLCDRLYGVSDPDPERARPFSCGGLTLERQALHAESLCFFHPVTGVALELRAPLAADLAALLEAGGGQKLAP